MDMDNFADKRDFALIAQDKYTFSVLSRIIKGDCEIRLTDHEKLIYALPVSPIPYGSGHLTALQKKIWNVHIRQQERSP